ncbi:hypothetical protein Ancab_024619 [Ancistrocladus abbreviatus]
MDRADMQSGKPCSASKDTSLAHRPVCQPISQKPILTQQRSRPLFLSHLERKFHSGAPGRISSSSSRKMGEETKPPEQSGTVSTAEEVDALLEAARYDDLDDIKTLESAGISLDSKDSQGRTALHMAAANGHLDIADYLVSKGVDLNVYNEEKNTPLHWACLNGHKEVVKNLILAGANVSPLNSHDRTPIDEALSRGKMDVVDAINEAVAQLELTHTTVS